MSLTKTKTSDRFRPQLETLDTRDVPALLWWSAVAGGAFEVVCDGGIDTVFVSDNGTGSVNNVVINVNGQPLIPQVSVWEVKVSTNGGNDSVTYEMTAPLNGSGWYRELEMELGAGNDYYAGY